MKIWDPRNKGYIYVKALLFLFTLQFFHMVYGWFPSKITFFFGATAESVFQHAKIAFFAYLIINLVEYFLRKNTIKNKTSFLDSRMLMILILPWLMFVIWYTAPAVYGPLEYYAEAVYAIITTYIMACFAFIIDKNLETKTFPLPIKRIIVICLILWIIELIIFAYEIPWADFFTEPEHLEHVH